MKLDQWENTAGYINTHTDAVEMAQSVNLRSVCVSICAAVVTQVWWEPEGAFSSKA